MRQRLTFSAFVSAGLCVALFSGCGVTSAVTNKVTDVIEKPKREEETKYSMARLHERNSSLKQAEELFLELHEKHPKKPEYAHRLANVYARMEKFSEAEKYYTIAQKLNPNNIDIYTDRGYAAMLAGDYEQAERYLREALDRKPNEVRASNNLGMVLAYQGKSDEALSYFRRSTSEAEALCNLAYVHVQRGEGNEAMWRYNQALSLDPTSKVAATGLTQLAEARQRVEHAQSLAGRNKAAPLPSRKAPPPATPSANREVLPVSAQERTPKAPQARPASEPSVPVRRAVKETPVETEQLEFDDSPGRASVKKSTRPATDWEMPDRVQTASDTKSRRAAPQAPERGASAARTAAFKGETKKAAIRPVDFKAANGLGGFSDPEDDEGFGDEEAEPAASSIRKTGPSKPWWQD